MPVFYAFSNIFISIHALLAESDGRLGFLSFHNSVFLSTLSLRRATYMGVTVLGVQHISIHALLAESDPGKIRIFNDIFRFLSTLSLRRATLVSMFNSPHGQISIHALLAESDSKSAQNSGALLRI